jgi:hypothetical protein
MTAKKKRKPQITNTKNERNRLSRFGGSAQADNAALDQSTRTNLANQAHRILTGTFDVFYNRNRKLPEDRVAWLNAVEVFDKAVQEAYSAVSLTQLKEGSPAGLEVAVAFLEADPWFFSSGYAKAELIRLINRFKLSIHLKKRLQKVVLAAIEIGDRREFRSYCRLAKKIYSPNFRYQLLQLQENPSIDVQRRSHWVLSACNKS